MQLLPPLKLWAAQAMNQQRREALVRTLLQVRRCKTLLPCTKNPCVAVPGLRGRRRPAGAAPRLDSPLTRGDSTPLGRRCDHRASWERLFIALSPFVIPSEEEVVLAILAHCRVAMWWERWCAASHRRRVWQDRERGARPVAISPSEKARGRASPGRRPRSPVDSRHRADRIGAGG